MSNDVVTYTLTYSNPSASTVANVTLSDSLPTTNGMSYVANSASNGGIYTPATNNLSWVIGPVGPGVTGTVTYQEQVVLLAGAYSPLTNNAQLEWPGNMVSASNSVTIAGTYIIHMGIYNEAGELIKGFNVFDLGNSISSFDVTGSLTSSPGAVSIVYNGTVLGTWDGKNTDGKTVTNGTYYVKIDSIDTLGVATTVTHNIAVQTVESTLDVSVYNEAGEKVKSFSQQDIQNLLGGALTAADEQVGKTKTSLNVITPSYTNPMGTGSYVTITLGSGRSFIWDGRGDNGKILTTGRYFIEVKANIAYGAQEQMVIPITVQANAGNAISGMILMPNPINLKQVTQAKFVISTALAQVDGVRVRIYTMAGELLKTQILDSTPGNPTQVNWNLNGVQIASGTYIAVAEIMSNGGLAGRQTLKVVVLH